METTLNLIITPMGLGICIFILLVTMISGWILHAYVTIKRGENTEYMTPKMEKKYYDEFMFKIGVKQIMKEEKYSIYLLKAVGNSILLLLIAIFYIVLGLAIVVVVKHYVWIGLVIGLTYWMVRKIFKKYKRKKLNFT